MKIKKGIHGYRHSHRKMQLTLVLVMVAAILIQLAARFLTDSQGAKNILTVMAVLTVLPMANMASPMIASWKYKTSSLDFYQKAVAYEPYCSMLYDLIITSKDCLMPMDAIAVYGDGVIAHCISSKVDVKKAESFLNEMLDAHGLPQRAKIIQEEGVFFRRLDGLKHNLQEEERESFLRTEALLKNLSM